MKFKKLSVLHIINVRWFNASAEYAIAISRYLKSSGHNILIVSKEGIPAIDKARSSGLEVDTAVSFSPMNFFTDLIKLKQICDKVTPDIIHAHHAEGHALSVALKRFFRGPKVIRTRVDIRAPKRNLFNRIIHRNTDCIIVPGELIKRNVVSTTGINPERVKVIYGGVDTEKFRSNGHSGIEFRRLHGIPEDAITIGLLARLDPVKGHLFFIKLARELKSIFSGLKFVVVGKDAEYKRNDLIIKAEKSGLGKDIIYTGFVDNVASAINSFDICVLSSLGSEAHPRVLFEYMACAKPVVASRVGIVNEIIDNGINGLIAEPADVNSYIEKIKSLVLSPEKRRELGAEARKKIEKNFAIDKFVKMVEELYFKVRGEM